MELITVSPHHGTQVSRIDINEIRCAFEVKIKLDGLAGAVAAKRITEEKTKDKKLIEKAKSLEREEDHTLIERKYISEIRIPLSVRGLEKIKSSYHKRPIDEIQIRK